MNGVPVMESPSLKYNSINGREGNTLDTLSQASKNTYVGKSK